MKLIGKNCSEIVNKLVFVLILSFFISCDSGSSNKVGFLIHQMEGRWFADVALLEQYAAEAGLELIVKNADGNENLQLAQASELIKEGVEVIIVVAANQNTAGGIVREAHKANIEVIAYDRIIANSDLDYLITFEYKSIGELLAKYALAKVPKGNYVMMWGDASDNNALLMRQGQEEFLKQYVDKGDVKLIYRTYTEGWRDINAKKNMEQILDFSSEKIDVVLANNDVIAQAVLEVYKDYGMEQPLVITGQDATLEACRSIFENGQTMTVFKSAKSTASETIKLASRIINGERNIEVKGTINNNRIDVPTLFMDPQIIDKTNVIDIVVGEGVYSKEEITGKQ